MLKILLCGIAGTSLMTAYSYRKSEKHREQFEEPLMLGKLVQRTIPERIPQKASVFSGWIAHYTIGVLFNMAYDRFWRNGPLEPGAASGFLLGAPSGLLGMAAWAAILKLHPDPPRTDLKKHLKQLFTAHIIFGVSSAVAYQVLRKK